MTTRPERTDWKARATGLLHSVGPGFLVSAVIALAAQFLSEHYGAPAMLMALLIGMAFHFLAEEGRCVAGIEWTAKTVLRFGVALLGARISLDMITSLGAGLLALVAAAVVLTIGFALIAARMLGRGWRLALLTGGSVAICGASAAMAIAAILPKNENSERNLIFTVVGVTMLSTIAMIAYPILATALGLSDRATGVFFGATIHDVAQVVGAGFSVSQEAGETATVVKLMRVVLLAPVVILFALAARSVADETPDPDGFVQRPPLLPAFIAAFLALVAINSAGLIPATVSVALGVLSRWALLTSIAAFGMQTALKSILDVGGAAIILIVAETVFIAALVLAGMAVLM